MADYQRTSSDEVIRNSDKAVIPNDPLNRDRIAYDEWLVRGGVPDLYMPPSPPVPQSISDRQFFQQLAVQGTISQDEALSAVKVGHIPAPLQSIVDAIVDPSRAFAAQMLLSGATTFLRDHPLTIAIGAAQGMTPVQIDAFFQDAAAL